MAEAWEMVRVRQATKAALGRLIDSRDQAAAAGLCARWWRGDEGPTYDEMIAWLVRQAVRKTERAAAARTRAQERRREETLQLVYDLAAQEDQED